MLPSESNIDFWYKTWALIVKYEMPFLQAKILRSESPNECAELWIDQGFFRPIRNLSVVYTFNIPCL